MIQSGESFAESYGAFVAWLLVSGGVDKVTANIMGFEGGEAVFQSPEQEEAWMKRLAERYDEFREG